MERTTSVLHNGTILLVLVGVAVSVCTIPFLDEILIFFGASERTLPYAYDFMLIILLANPIAYLFVGLNNVMRSTGYPRKAMYTALLSVVVNLILAPIFIFNLNMGIKGAAWATVIGQIVSFLVCAIYFIKPKSFILTKKSFLIDFKVLKNLVLLGASTFITQVSIAILSLVSNMMLAKYGSLSVYGKDIPISVFNIITKVFTIVLNIIGDSNDSRGIKSR